MTTLERLKHATSRSDVAMLLDFTPRGLAHTLYKATIAEKYYKFQIAKKSGGTRNICAPKGAMKFLQRKLADILYDCCDEINQNSKLRALSHGFRRNHSIFDNARQHKGRRFVLNLDLKDFFPTFNFGRVRGFFMKNRDFALNERVATVLAQIACFEGSLPQGSPCSPIISDMIAHILDVRVAQLAKLHRVTYSRYADDLTFSTNQKEFPPALAYCEQIPGSEWKLGEELVHVIDNAGFQINPEKTRMQLKAGRQVVTGLTVNTKVNVPGHYAGRARAMCDSLFRAGLYHRRVSISPPPESGASYEMVGSLNQLEGILSFIHHIKRQSESIKPRTPGSKIEVPGRELYKQFLFYRYFVAPSKPLILCEGRTDNIYIKYAVRHLANLYPSLGGEVDGVFVPVTALFSYENEAHKIIELTGGFDPLLKFINQYKMRLRRYQHRPFAHPVIVLIDNDSAVTSMKGNLKKQFQISVELTSAEPFYHLTSNLYVVKTPEKGATGTSCIEDCFADELKGTLLDGKSFNPEKNLDPTTQYGKAPFAEKVVVPRSNEIDWDGFRPLLDRISAVLAHYVAPASAIVDKAA